MIAEQLPHRTTALQELAVDLTQSIADGHRIAVVAGEAAETTHALFAISLSNLGLRLDALGRREEALAVNQEAVDIYRRLVQSRPDAFLPVLAMSISGMSSVLAALDRHGEAAQAATQAVEILAPFVERYSQTYQGLAGTIVTHAIRYSEAAGQQPDVALLARVAMALLHGQTVEVIEALKEMIDAILDAAEKTGALDEDTLAKWRSGLAEQLRAAWAAARSGSGTENPGG